MSNTVRFKDLIESDAQSKVDSLRKEIQGLKKDLENIKGFKPVKIVRDNSGQEAKKLGEGISSIKKNVSELDRATRNLNKAQSDEAKLVAKLRLETQQLNKETKQSIQLDKAQKGSIEALRLSTNKLIKERDRLGNITGKNAKQFKELTRQINANNQQLLQHDKAIGRSQRNVGNYGSALAGVGRQLAGAAGVTLGLAGFVMVLRNGLNTISSFEQATANLAAILGKNVDQISDLTNSSLELGASTEFTASQVTSLQEAYARLGFSEKEILGVTEATLQGATALRAGLGEAAELVGGTLRAMNLDVSETQRVVDVLTASTTNSALNFEKLNTSIAIAAPIAQKAGIPIEKLSADLGVLANNNLDASTSGTSLRNIYLELAKQGLTYDEALEKINTSTNKNSTAMTLFGKRGATAALILADQQEEAIKLERALRSSGGTAEQVAKTQLATLEGQTKLLSSAWEGFILRLDRGNGFISKISKGIVSLATNILNLGQEQKKSIDLFNLTNTELNTQFEVIKNTNLSQEVRKELINKINKEYKDYLPNLLTEKSTLEEIEIAQKAVNDQLRLKVLQQAFQEEINEALKEEKERLEALVGLESSAAIQAEKAKNIRADASGEEIQFLRDQAEAFKDIEGLATKNAENVTKDTQENINSIKKRFQILADLYNLAFEDIENRSKTSTDVMEVESENQIDTFKNILKELRESFKLREIALKESLINGEITREEFRQKELELELEFLLERQKLEDKFGESSLSTQEKIADKRIELLKQDTNAFKKASKELEEIFNKQSLALREQLLNDEITQDEFREKEIANEIAFLEAKKMLLESFGESTINIEKQIADRKLAIKQSNNEKEKELDDQRVDFIISNALKAADAVSQIISRNIQENQDKEIASLENSADRRLQDLENFQGTEEQKARRKEQIEKDLQDEIERVQREAFEKKKTLDTVSAIINGALAITKVLAQTGVTSPFIIPSIIATTGLQIATIQSQKFEKGGTWIEGGKRHFEGGNLHQGNKEFEKGERVSVFNRKATLKHDGLIKDFTNSINSGNIDKFALNLSNNISEPSIVNNIMFSDKTIVNKLSSIETQIKKQNAVAMFPDGKGGYVDINGNVISPPKYD